MKRTDLRANTTYAVRRTDDAVVPARLLDSVNLWSPLLDSDQKPTDEFRVHEHTRIPLPDGHRRTGLLMIVLNTPKPPDLPLLTSRTAIERYARRLDALPPLGLLERDSAGLRAWRARSADAARWMPLKTDVVPNHRILHAWGTPSVVCPGCGRAGWVLDGEGRLPTHDSAPPLRAVCSSSGAVVAGV